MRESRRIASDLATFGRGTARDDDHTHAEREADENAGCLHDSDSSGGDFVGPPVSVYATTTRVLTRCAHRARPCAHGSEAGASSQSARVERGTTSAIRSSMPIERTRPDRAHHALRPRRTDADPIRTRRPDEVTETRPTWHRRAAFVERPADPQDVTNEVRAPRAHRGIGAGLTRGRAAGPQPGHAGGGAGTGVGIGQRQRPPRPSPPGANDEGFVPGVSGRPTFYGTENDDNYLVRQNDRGLQIVNLDTGDIHEVTHEEARDGVAIFLRGGDDRITVDPSVTYDLMVHGGDDDDTIDASNARAELLAWGGDGRDKLYGGSADDQLDGGRGNDEVRGGAGDDWVYGNDGDDSVIGEGGDDVVTGGDGQDVVMGSAGVDRVYGGDGSDAIYADADDAVIDAGVVARRGDAAPGGDDYEDLIVAEQGSVAVDGLDSIDVVVHHDPAATQAWLDAHPEIEIDDTDPEFAARVRADLGVMLATPHSADLLEEITQALDDQDETLVFTQRDRVGGSFGRHDTRDDTFEVESSLRTEAYEEQFELLGDLVHVTPESNRFPLTATFHELVHAYQRLIGPDPEGHTVTEDGRATENDELQATGLPWLDENLQLQAGGVGADRNGTPYSDNAFRDAIGLRTRQRYDGEDGAASPLRTLGYRLWEAFNAEP